MTPTPQGPNADIVVRVYQHFDRGDLEALRALYADNVEMITPDEHVQGIDGAISLLRAIHTAFPDLRHELVSAIEDGDAIACEWRVTATHAGPLSGPEGEIPPTGKRIDLMLAEIVRISDGRIARSASYWDNAAMAMQLDER
jgi:steroid delta-isomerase-like uncharacterized protein